MADLDLLPEPESRNQVLDWAIRVSVAIVYFLIGVGKFSFSPGSHWVTVFEQIHAGQWFRYWTGIIESSAALLVLIPRTASFGLLLFGLHDAVRRSDCRLPTSRAWRSCLSGITVSGSCGPRLETQVARDQQLDSCRQTGS